MPDPRILCNSRSTISLMGSRISRNPYRLRHRPLHRVFRKRPTFSRIPAPVAIVLNTAYVTNDFEVPFSHFSERGTMVTRTDV